MEFFIHFILFVCLRVFHSILISTMEVACLYLVLDGSTFHKGFAEICPQHGFCLHGTMLVAKLHCVLFESILEAV